MYILYIIYMYYVLHIFCTVCVYISVYLQQNNTHPQVKQYFCPYPGRPVSTL